MKPLHPFDLVAALKKQATGPHLVFAVSRRHSPFSLFTRSVDPGALWGHSAFFDEGTRKFNEALLFKGVVETDPEEWVLKQSSFELFLMHVPNPHEGVEFARAQRGKKYDYFGASSVPFRGSWQDDNRWYCSEKDTMITHNAGRVLFIDPHRGIHPHDFRRVAT